MQHNRTTHASIGAVCLLAAAFMAGAGMMDSSTHVRGDYLFTDGADWAYTKISRRKITGVTVDGDYKFKLRLDRRIKDGKKRQTCLGTGNIRPIKGRRGQFVMEFTLVKKRRVFVKVQDGTYEIVWKTGQFERGIFRGKSQF